MTVSDSWTKEDIELWKILRTISEGITTSDSDSSTPRTWKYIRIISEPMTVSDSDSTASRLWKKFRTLAEPMTASDSDSATSRLWKKFRTLAEPMTVSESDSATSRLWKKFRTIEEPITVTEVDSDVARLWIKVRAISEAISTIDVASEGHLRILDEILSVTDSWTKTIARKGSVYQLDGTSGDESFSALYRTGWIMPKTLSKSPIVRRLNIDYLSDSAITVKVFADDDITTPLTTKSFSASSTSAHGSIRLGTRVKYFLISIETTQSANENVRIERIEIEVDD